MNYIILLRLSIVYDVKFREYDSNETGADIWMETLSDYNNY